MNMQGSTFGTILRLTSFGESHGVGIGGIIDGFPAGFEPDFEAIQKELDRRKPGQSAIVTQRKEADEVKFLSGIYQGKTTGTPIAFLVENTHQRSEDYDTLSEVYRPSHADYTYTQKYGHRDPRGGGRSSARETVARVVAGALAKQFLEKEGIQIDAWVDQVGPIRWKGDWHSGLKQVSETNAVRVPDIDLAVEMEAYIKEIRKQGDTVGGAISCVINGVPIGLGEPVFQKLNSALGAAMLSINAVKGFEFGTGFAAIEMKGSEHNDLFHSDGSTQTNHSGGIQGGISNGMPIEFRVAFKPVATLMQSQTMLTKENELIEVQGKGRHDPCVVPRAVPIVEAMAALVILDHFLLRNAYQFSV